MPAPFNPPSALPPLPACEKARRRLPALLPGVLLLLALLAGGCAASAPVRRIETTAYCGCGECCGYVRGSWWFLKLNFWNRYLPSGAPYTGRTASGTRPHWPHPGLFSTDSLLHPWWIPCRVVFFPWLLLPRPGTVAADTAYYPFGTRVRVPGYGWGVVEDRGSAIRGPDRLDLFMPTHGRALEWGRKRVDVVIEKP